MSHLYNPENSRDNFGQFLLFPQAGPAESVQFYSCMDEDMQVTAMAIFTQKVKTLSLKIKASLHSGASEGGILARASKLPIVLS